MEVSVRVDVQRALTDTRLARPRVMRAAATAINRTATSGRALMSRRIKARRKVIGGLSSAALKENIAIQRASPSRLSARLMMFGGRHIPLSQYRHAMSKSGFRVDVVGDGMKLVSDYGNRGFERQGLRAGGASIRTQAARTPTKLLRGPTLASAITAHGWQRDVLAPELLERFRATLGQQLAYQLSLSS
ncbi:MAG: hypothetical protein KGL39_40100 [Patescibacteria group bacterium]|nr:hypothetical protein [Patescibacteria group bacterium]